MSLYARRLSESDFFELEPDWTALLANSSADPLFMSWAWQVSWWETWSRELDLELMLIGVFDSRENLMALAPFYLSAVRTPLGWRVRRLHVVGNAWKLGPTVRTEYVNMIVDRRVQQPAMDAIADYLAQLEWDEMIVADASARAMSMVEASLSPRLPITRLVRSESEGVVIPTKGSFEGWLGRLGRNTRLKAYNRRRLFAGELNGQFLAWADTNEFLTLLNNFHRERWGKPCFDVNAIRFHQALLSRLSGSQSAQFSALQVGGQVVSVLYDIRAGNRIYNLQAGFSEQLHPKLSLGTLHLGFAIEEAFRDKDILSYDLLAGSGKNTFYKSHFQGERAVFTTVEYVRSPVLKLAYGARSCMPQRLVSSINRFFRL